MSLPKALEAKVKYPVSLDLAMFLSDLEAFFNGALTECPACGGAGTVFGRLTTTRNVGWPCPNNCDQGQVRGPGLEARIMERLYATVRANHPGQHPEEAMHGEDVLEALRIELSDSTSPTSPGTEGK